jgi:hypothetical protein
MANLKEIKAGRVPEAKVNVEGAREFAPFEVRKNRAANVLGFEELGGTSLGDEPLVIYYLNGKALFYEFDIRSRNKSTGVINASSRKRSTSRLDN